MPPTRPPPLLPQPQLPPPSDTPTHPRNHPTTPMLHSLDAPSRVAEEVPPHPQPCTWARCWSLQCGDLQQQLIGSERHSSIAWITSLLIILGKKGMTTHVLSGGNATRIQAATSGHEGGLARMSKSRDTDQGPNARQRSCDPTHRFNADAGQCTNLNTELRPMSQF